MDKIKIWLTFVIFCMLSFVKISRGHFYRVGEKLTETNQQFIGKLLIEKTKPSKLTCVHYCKVKFKDVEIIPWFDEKQTLCRCFVENGVEGKSIRYPEFTMTKIQHLVSIAFDLVLMIILLQ